MEWEALRKQEGNLFYLLPIGQEWFIIYPALWHPPTGRNKSDCT